MVFFGEEVHPAEALLDQKAIVKKGHLIESNLQISLKRAV